MNSSSDKIVYSTSIVHPQALDLKYLLFEKDKENHKKIGRNREQKRLHEYQRKKNNIRFLEKYARQYLLSFYINAKDDYNIRMIEDILNNESTHLVAEFKDYLIMGDITEFLNKTYNMEEIKKYLPKIYEYYNSCSVIFPNYVALHESKYIYKNIRKKQKVIDHQQEQDEKQEKIKKGDIKLDENDEFFTSKTFNSILNQTNTSNVKVYFGINDRDNDLDSNETPNNIIAKLEKAEKDVFQKKINLIKNIKKPILNDNNFNESNTLNSLNNNSHLLSNNNSKIYFKSKYLNERNKNKNNLNCLNTQKNNVKMNENMRNNSNNQKINKIKIHNDLASNQLKNESDSKNVIKSSTSIHDIENNTKKNYVTIYGNNFINTKKIDTKKLYAENSNTKNKKSYQIYIRGNHSNKNIKKQYINSLFPTKNIITKIFNNLNNNSVLKHNSFNFINQKLSNKNNKEENQYTNTPGFSLSPSSNTIQMNNPYRKKFGNNININIKESNSTRNINNSKISARNKTKEKLNLKNTEEKIKRNKDYNQNSLNYNSNTISTTTGSKTTSNKDKIKIKYIHINKNYNYNKSQMKNIEPNYNKFPNFRTITNSGKSNNNVKNYNLNQNNCYYNNLVKKDKNIHKINSTSNIKKPINMNININMNNNSKNKIFFNEGSYENIIGNKIFPKNPLNTELETIKVSKKKKTLYIKKRTLSDIYNKNHNIIINNNFNGNLINSINNNTLTIDTYNTSNRNEEFNNVIKNDYIFGELNKKKNIVLPIGKQINNINININGLNINEGSLTSRACNNENRKRIKGNNGQEINHYNKEFKMKDKSKNVKKNNMVSKNENNPVMIKKMYDNIQHIKNLEHQNGPGYLTSRNKNQ